MSLSACCASGVRIEGGEKLGKEQLIGGVNTYVSLPEGDYDKTKAFILLTDIFGIQFNNNVLLADDFAKQGVAVYVPDYLNGDPCPANALEPDSGFDLGKWFGSHGPDATRPPVDKVIAALKAEGVTKFFGSGHCLGGRYVVDGILDGTFAAGAIHHPSLLSEDDLPKLKEKNAPLLWNTCEIDEQWGPEKQKKGDEVLGGTSGYKRNYYPGAQHGFSTRGDMSKQEVRDAKEGAFKSTVEWFKAYL